MRGGALPETGVGELSKTSTKRPPAPPPDRVLLVTGLAEIRSEKGQKIANKDTKV